MLCKLNFHKFKLETPSNNMLIAEECEKCGKRKFTFDPLLGVKKLTSEQKKLKKAGQESNTKRFLEKNPKGKFMQKWLDGEISREEMLRAVFDAK